MSSVDGNESGSEKTNRMSSLESWKNNMDELMESGMEDFEDKLFTFLADSENLVSIDKFKSLLEETGLKETDFRLKETMAKFGEVFKRQMYDGTEHRGRIQIDTFKECVSENVVVISRALKNQFIIPEWKTFTDMIDDIYESCKHIDDGKISNPAKFNSDQWAVSICSTDGQRYTSGDADTPFCLHSAVKPLIYALCLNDLSPEVVHRYVGQEPSGGSFNDLALDYEHKPHNPLINAGAIVIASLLKKGEMIADRFEFAMREMQRFTGDEYLAFSNSDYLLDRASADRNFALGHYMKENKCFPEEADLTETLEFYLQLMAIEVTAESGAVIAATLANGGICPTTGERILDSDSIRNTLSLMHSCGMYDYSGQFAFNVGLPAKSGGSGGIMLIIPNVMGIFMWSPPLDPWGNSTRGVRFCQELVGMFNFHNYDNLRHRSSKYDPRGRASESMAQDVVNLLFSAYNGDVTAMRRYALIGLDMSMADYDGRTALHLAAAEGHIHVVRFILEKCKVSPDPKDRWGFKPYDDAKKFNHARIAKLLKQAEKRHMSDALD